MTALVFPHPGVMPTDLLAFVSVGALLLALSSLLLPRSVRYRGAAAIALAALGCGAITVQWFGREAAVQESEVTQRPVHKTDAGYVGSTTCRACHPLEHATWYDSYHRTMTQVATAETVLGDFDDVEMTRKGERYRLQRDDDGFWVELEDPYPQPGQKPGRVRRRIALTTGSNHMQVYWFESGFSRTLGQLPFSWQIAERRWITRDASFVLPTEEKPSLQFGGWSLVCVKCHATNGRPRLDLENGQMRGSDTQVSEFGIACEACHGPGGEHVRSNQNPVRRYAQRLSGEPDPTIVNPKRLDAVRSTQVCGQCHGVWDYHLDQPGRLDHWSKAGFDYRPGGDATQNRTLKFEGEDQFWSDGLIRTAGREYNALAHSLCHETGGMTCLSCHVMHPREDDGRSRAEWANDQLRPGDDNQSCLECHTDFRQKAVEHSHHAAGSAGNSCVNCHMPHTTYGLMKGVRTHRIESPSVKSTLATGRPNACNMCHLDKPLAWTASHLQQWYGIEAPAMGESDREISAAVRLVLEGDAAQRALMSWALRWPPAQQASGREWLAPYLAELLDDPYPAVRIIAERSLRTLPGFESFRHELDDEPRLRAEAKQAALTAWRSQAATRDERPEVLLQADGLLDSKRYDYHLKQRDLRELRLPE